MAGFNTAGLLLHTPVQVTMSIFRRRPYITWSVILVVAGLFFIYHPANNNCPDNEGLEAGLARRVVRKDLYDLEKIGLGNGAIRGGLAMEMVSESEKTKHSFNWPETSEVLKDCGRAKWSSNLPNVSVIITFIDQENISTLLHTIHSVMQRTPRHLLQELILIADNSKKDDLGEVLDIYVNTVFNTKVRLYRSTEQLGLIRARLQGIRMAQGEVVISMDSHVEVQKGWVEPLLHEIVKNPKTLAASTLDWMEKDKSGVWEYKHAGTFWKTYFDWHLVFGFQAMSDKEKKERKSNIEPINSPVTIGTIFAIKKSWFTEIGEFDEGMKLWGGENLDLPMRVWLCGGRVINVPCSRVAHLEYARNRAYRDGWDKQIRENYKRFAVVWMDDFIKYIYKNYPDLEAADVGNLTSRFALKKQCPHDIQWYLDNVYPELGLPEEQGLGFGGLRNLGIDKCLTSQYGGAPNMFICGQEGAAGAQSDIFWSNLLELRMPVNVFNVRSHVEGGRRKQELEQLEAIGQYGERDKTTKFIHWENGPIIAVGRDLCLEAFMGMNAIFKPCRLEELNQQWHFQSYSSLYHEIIEGKSEKFAHIAEKIHFYKQKFTKQVNERIALADHPPPQRNKRLNSNAQ